VWIARVKTGGVFDSLTLGLISILLFVGSRCWIRLDLIALLFLLTEAINLLS